MRASAVEVKKSAAVPEMLGRVRRFDWAATSLGPMEKWPRTLIGVYGKLRPGFMSCDKNPYVPTLGTSAALDFGGILEFYSRRHIAARVDLGGTVVWYGSGIVIPAISRVGGSVVPGTRNQHQWNIGVSGSSGRPGGLSRGRKTR